MQTYLSFPLALKIAKHYDDLIPSSNYYWHEGGKVSEKRENAVANAFTMEELLNFLPSYIQSIHRNMHYYFGFKKTSDDIFWAYYEGSPNDYLIENMASSMFPNSNRQPIDALGGLLLMLFEKDYCKIIIKGTKAVMVFRDPVDFENWKRAKDEIRTQLLK